MERNHLRNSILAAGLLLALMAGLAAAQTPQATPLGTDFTYQGQLKQDGNPMDGTCDFRFSLWDAPSDGNPIGSTQSPPPVGVADGTFTVQLDFGSDAFRGDGRWLEIGVCCPSPCAPGYTPLSPRQELTASPYALYSAATPWTGLSGVPAGFADGVDDNTIYSAGAGLMMTSTTTFAVDTTYIQRRVSGSCAAGSAIRVVTQNGQVTCQPVDANAWLLTGNAGTNPATNYLGTSDDAALEIKVNGQRAVRVEPHAASPNLIGGYSRNWVADDVAGATIGGGGVGNDENWVSDWCGTVGGGEMNWAGNNAGDVWDGAWATVGGGVANWAFGEKSTVGGGLNNTAGGGGSTVGGGAGNRAGGVLATVPGGEWNTAEGAHSFAAGWWAYAGHDGSFVWADSQGSQFGSSAPNQFLVRASGGVGINTGAPVANTLTVAGDGVRSETSSTSGTAVYGYNSATTGTAVGVRGQSDSTSGKGVVGVATAGSGTTVGVLGEAASGVSWGVVGWNDWNGAGVGAWSEVGDLIQAYDGDFPGGALRFKVDQDGNVHLDGSLIYFGELRSPAAGQPDHASLYGLVSTEVWFEDLGSGRLVAGRAEVPIDPLFAQTVALTETYNIYLTATCQEPVLLFVSDKAAGHFVVEGVRLDGQPSSCGFDYRLAAKRLGYQDLRLEAVDIPAPVEAQMESQP
jgi:hypothetical protein